MQWMLWILRRILFWELHWWLQRMLWILLQLLRLSPLVIGGYDYDIQLYRE